MTVVPFRRPSPPPPPPPSGPKKPEPREATKPAVEAQNVLRDGVPLRFVWGRPACWSVWVLLGVQPLDQNASA